MQQWAIKSSVSFRNIINIVCLSLALLNLPGQVDVVAERRAAL